MSQTSDTPRTDNCSKEISQWLKNQSDVEVVATNFARQLERELNAEKQAHEFTATAYSLMRDQRDKLERELNAAKHDIEAYRGALGYSVPVSHDGKLSDSSNPQCGLCNSEYTRLAKEFYDRWQNDSSLETWFPITFEEICRLKIQMNELVEYARHTTTCEKLVGTKDCNCGLSKLLEEIRA